MKNMLGVALCEVRGPLDDLMKKLSGDKWEVWLVELKKFLRGEPSWAGEMIYKPLEWSPDRGEMDLITANLLVGALNAQLINSERWRLPTDGELSRALGVMKPSGFVVGKYYWTSTPHYDGHGTAVVYTHNGCGGLGYSSDEYQRTNIHLRLVREMKLPT